MSIIISARQAARMPVFFLFIFVLVSLSACLETPKTFAERGETTGVDDTNDTDTTPANEEIDSTTPVGADYKTGYWQGGQALATLTLPTTDNPAIEELNLDVDSSNKLFLSMISKNSTSGAESIIFKRGVLNTGTYTLTEYDPVGITANATDILFTTNKAKGDGYALWDNGTNLSISEFMGTMNHFMNTFNVGSGHSNQILVDTSGDNAYLLNQGHMDGGFAINVRPRSGSPAWSSAPVQLHRMAAGIDMPNHLVKGIIDGQGNVAAVWLESLGGATTIKSARFNTTSNTWGSVEIVADGTNTVGLMADKVLNFALMGEPNSANLHVLVYQDSGTEKAIYTVDFTTAWGAPVKRTTLTATTHMHSAPVFSSNNVGTLTVAWIENDNTDTTIAAIQRIKSIQYINGSGWSNLANTHNTKPSVTIKDLFITINDNNHQSASWVEQETGVTRILSSHKKSDANVWTSKEMIKSFDGTGALPSIPQTVLLSNETPIVLWLESSNASSNTNFVPTMAVRKDTIHVAEVDTTVAVNETPVVETPVEVTPAEETPVEETPVVEGIQIDSTPPVAAATVVRGTVLETAWNTTTDIAMADIAANTSPTSNNLSLQFDSDNKIFSSWNIANTNAQSVTSEQIMIRTSTLSTNSTMTWTDPDVVNALNTATTVTEKSQFILNPVTKDAYAIKTNGDQISATEYMGAMGHIMNAQSVIATGHAPKVLIKANGDAYIVAQGHMTGGFGMSVYKRNGANAPPTWDHTMANDMLHRMNNATMPNHLFSAAINGSGNIVTVWLEENAGAYALYTAVYNTVTGTWGTASMIANQTSSLALNNLVSMHLNTETASNDVQLVLFLENASATAIYTSTFNAGAATPAWQAFLRRDFQLPVKFAPSVAMKNGHMLIAWIETDSSSGMAMDQIIAQQYKPDTGWQNAEFITPVGHMIQANDLSISVNSTGNASALWLESDSTGSRVLSSHKLENKAWSTIELIRDIATGSGLVQANRIALNDNGIPVIFGTIKMSTMLHTWFTARGADISTATVRTTTTPAPVTPTPTVPPVTQNWTLPLAAMDVSHAGAITSNTKTELNIAIDNNQNGIVNMWVDNRANGATIPENHLVRNTSFGTWADAMGDNSLFNGLSNAAILEFVRIAPATGNLFALVRDTDKLWLARQLSDGISWGKVEIPGVPVAVSRNNLQMVISETGMVTLTWHDQASNSFDININAKHFMNNMWEATQTLTVATEKVLTPHYVDNNDKIQAAWLVQSSSGGSCGFDIKMATYEHMVGWSQAFSGPTCIDSNVVIKSVNNGTQRLVIVANEQSYEIEAYIINSNGTWTAEPNINAADELTILTGHDEIQVITGGMGRFLVAWRELIGNEIHYRSVSAHYMVDNTGMGMWHWGTPSTVGGMNTGIESNLKVAMDSAGNAYAVWTGMSADALKSRVYANVLAAGGSWENMPEMLVEYDTTTDGFADKTSIAIDMSGRVAIAWDEQMLMGTMTMHHIWTVESN